MTLTDVIVRQAKATGRSRTLPDFDGLSLAVSATGAKSWHFRYSWLSQQKRMSLGTYPEISLREARARRDEARALVAKGYPQRQREKECTLATQSAQNTFETVYEKWYKFRKQDGLKKGRQTSLTLIPRIFAKDILPALRHMSILEITRADLLEIIGRIERRGAPSVAEKVRTWFSQLFRYALVTVPGMEQSPASDLDVVAMPQPPVRHNPFLRLSELPEFLHLLRKYPGRLQTQLGLRILLLTGVRTGELHHINRRVGLTASRTHNTMTRTNKILCSPPPNPPPAKGYSRGLAFEQKPPCTTHDTSPLFLPQAVARAWGGNRPNSICRYLDSL